MYVPLLRNLLTQQLNLEAFTNNQHNDITKFNQSVGFDFDHMNFKFGGLHASQ